ncbi:hypothetical protein NUKP61_22890 [Klebsiella variicola]|nr:hypothetical protein NUKP61_22890 [Klebsiella variicola]
MWVFAIREAATTLQLAGDRTDAPVSNALIQLADFRREYRALLFFARRRHPIAGRPDTQR